MGYDNPYGIYGPWNNQLQPGQNQDHWEIQLAAPPHWHPKSDFSWNNIGNADKNRHGFLFCFVREFHPEVFQIADFLDSIFRVWGALGTDIYDPGPDRLIDPGFTILNQSYPLENINWNGEFGAADEGFEPSYYFNRHDRFVSIAQEEAPVPIYTDEAINRMNEYTRLCIRLTKFVTNIYPSLLSIELKYFFSFQAIGEEYDAFNFNLHNTNFFVFWAEEQQLAQQIGGSKNNKSATKYDLKKKSFDFFSSIIADLYQEYMMLDIKYSSKYKLNRQSLFLKGNEKYCSEYVNDLYKLADELGGERVDDPDTKLLYSVEAFIVRRNADMLSTTKTLPQTSLQVNVVNNSSFKTNNRSSRQNSKTVTRHSNSYSRRKKNTKRNNTKKRNNSTRRNNRSKAMKVKN